MIKYLKTLLVILLAGLKNPKLFVQLLNAIPTKFNANQFINEYSAKIRKEPVTLKSKDVENNPLWDYFQRHKEGPGIWKWEHYFSIYHKFFQKYINSDVKILEIGIYSGGSLGMWSSYFGVNSMVYGVDIEDACKSYEKEGVKIFIGDQSDRNFWKKFKEEVGTVDIVIDDGGHTSEQQRITLEEILPIVSPGGIYLCEDIHGVRNRFTDFSTSLIGEMNDIKGVRENGILTESTAIQQIIHSISYFPFVMVIEKNEVPVLKLKAPKHGTEWQPFL